MSERWVSAEQIFADQWSDEPVRPWERTSPSPYVIAQAQAQRRRRDREDDRETGFLSAQRDEGNPVRPRERFRRK